MPKTRIPTSRGQKSRGQRIKFKIGGRKSTKSALTCPVSELTPSRNRDKPKIEQARHLRGLPEVLKLEG